MNAGVRLLGSDAMVDVANDDRSGVEHESPEHGSESKNRYPGSDHGQGNACDFRSSLDRERLRWSFDILFRLDTFVEKR